MSVMEDALSAWYATVPELRQVAEGMSLANDIVSRLLQQFEELVKIRADAQNE